MLVLDRLGGGVFVHFGLVLVLLLKLLHLHEVVDVLHVAVYVLLEKL